MLVYVQLEKDAEDHQFFGVHIWNDRTRQRMRVRNFTPVIDLEGAAQEANRWARQLASTLEVPCRTYLVRQLRK